MFAHAGSSQIISGERNAHAALENEASSNKELHSLTFHLLVAGELEIISDENISKKEQFTRIELLKKLAYMHEYLPQEEATNQYVNFINKVKKGKFKWGSKSDLRAFEQGLIYTMSAEARKCEKRKQIKNNTKFEERKKYCLDFNRGTCKFDKSHKGKINGTNVFKLHVCKRCLVQEDIEAQHAEKDCPKQK